MGVRDLMPAPGDVAAGIRLLRSLPGVLRHPLDVAAARATLRRRLAERESQFLAHVGRVVYSTPGSPYRTLLDWAGCERGDLERLVEQDGLEAALATLHRRGVYLTADEFRGRQDVARGALRLRVRPADLRPPAGRFHLSGQSGGSRGARLPVRIDLAWLRDRGVDAVLALEARGALGWRHAVWSVPGSAILSIILRYSLCGGPPVRWFSQIDPRAPALPSRYRWSARVLQWGGRLAGVPLPGPLFAPVDAPEPVLRWIGETLRVGQTPHVDTFPSSAVRLCLAAEAQGLDLTGAHFTLAGEPLTRARRDVIERVGAKMATYYACAGVGILGFWCLQPETSDEVHLANDLCAVIQPAGAGSPEAPSSGPLLVTSLRPAAPFVLINVGLGDEAVISRRMCGCPLEALGWATHLQSIRSYEKLTAAGVTLPDGDVVRALEEVLPGRFGGMPTDYQLVEDARADGRPRLRLLVHPRVGLVDGRAVAEAFLGALANGPGAERVMQLALRRAGVLEVERRAAMPTPAGKILHLHADGDETLAGSRVAPAESA